MQFSAAIAVHTSSDKSCLVLGNFYFASPSYSDDAGDPVTSQEQLIVLKLLNKSVFTCYVLTSFTQEPTHTCDRGADTNKIRGRQLPFHSKFNHTKPPKGLFPCSHSKEEGTGDTACVYIPLTGQLCMLNHLQLWGRISYVFFFEDLEAKWSLFQPKDFLLWMTLQLCIHFGVCA